ncbi:hypothetical protein ACVK1X_003069 [Pseudomonas sp. PvR086]
MKNAILLVLGILTITFAASTLILYQKHSYLPTSNSEAITAEKSAPHDTSQKINGQIFIITRGGESIPLGGVIVSAYTQKVFQDSLPKIYKAIVQDASALTPKVEFLSGEADKLWESSKKFTGTKGSVSKLSKILNQWLATANLRDATYRELLEKTSGRRYLAELPQTSAKTQTDATGKFELALPSKKQWVIAACASREIAKEKEKYCWFTKSNNEKYLLLNNNNIFGIESEDAAAAMPELPINCEYKDCILYAKTMLALYSSLLEKNSR